MTEVPAEILKLVDVPRETSDRLAVYYDLLLKWQSRINLISPNTIPDAWTRHFLDSAQLLPLIRKKTGRDSAEILDFGSGAGFPGLVLACLDAGPVTLVESDQRKGAFLNTVIRETKANAKVETLRIEGLEPRRPDVITARALAPVAQLIAYSAPHLTENTEMWLLKGQNVASELEEASTCWAFRSETFPSLSDPKGSIVRLTHVSAKRGS